MNLEIMIPSDEPVRLLSAVLEELDYRKLTATDSYIGRIEYSPRLLFKVVLYACTRGIYSSREIERACRENVNFMYLLEGHAAPDHNTIARFRSQHLPDAAEDLLYQMVQILAQNGEISLDFHRGRDPASGKPLHPGRGCVCSGQRGYEFQTLYDAGPQECIG